jgi:hypothetical protein
MKVELALLSDTATFACYLNGRVVAGVLELHGNVPDESVRQRALELARRSTFLKVADALQIRANMIVRPPLRPARVLQQEAAELLQKNFGEPAQRMSLGVRTNGVIVLAGPIDSVESKLEISRLFRRLPGCFGVVNGLTVQRVARDGQHVVLVTNDGSMVVPSSALELESVQPAVPPLVMPQPKPVVVAPSPVAPLPSAYLPSAVPPVPLPPPPQVSANEPPAPTGRQSNIPPLPPLTLASATPLPAKSLEAQKDELRLPTPVPPKPAPERIGCVPYTPSEPKLPVKWTSLAPNWESQVNKLEPVNAPPASAAPPTARQQAELPLPSAILPKPAPERNGCVPHTPSEPKPPVNCTSYAPNRESQVNKLEPVNAPPDSPAPPAAPQQAETPPWTSPAARPAETKWARAVAANSEPSGTSNSSRPNIAETQAPSAPAMTRHRPGASEESEIKASTVPVKKETPLNAPLRPKLASVAPPQRSLSSSRRWPPAYEPSPPPSKGRPGLIVFDDDPAPPPKPLHVATATPPAIVPDKLQRQVKSACGWQARAVTVETQSDGIVLVRVKVPNLSVEDQLTRKILAIPEMTGPKVRLMMDVGP